MNKRYVNLYQENDRAPRSWRAALQLVDGIFPGSRHTIEATIDEPYFEKFNAISLAGITESFNFDAKPIPNFYPGKFIFLMVGASQPRKNTNQLIRDYCQVFTNKDDVILLIKDFDYGFRGTTEELIREMRKDKNCPEIVYIFEDWERPYLARVYKTVSLRGAYLHPHKAECFGMPLLEAAACGCRIATTKYAGPYYNFKDIAAKTGMIKFFSYKMEPSAFHNHPGEPFYEKDEAPEWAAPDDIEIKKYMIDIQKEKYDKEQGKALSKYVVNKFGYPTIAKNVKKFFKNLP